MTLVISPRISEKSFGAAGSENGVYTFMVPKSSNKHEVKKAVEKLYEVTVLNVNISILKGKTKRFMMKGGKSSTGTRQNLKKAYVTLKKGDNIPAFNIASEEDKPVVAKTKTAKKAEK